eukprot:g30587.t1
MTTMAEQWMPIPGNMKTGGLPGHGFERQVDGLDASRWSVEEDKVLVPAQMPVKDGAAPLLFSPEMFKGQWLDSLGNQVFVCFEDEQATTLVAHLTRPPRRDLKLFMWPVPRGGGWQCGNAVLDPSSAWPKLCWVTEDGRVSTWVRTDGTDYKEERVEQAIHVKKKSESAKAKDFAVSAQMRREANAGIESAEQRLSDIDARSTVKGRDKGLPIPTADREDNGEEGALERPSRKALKRKAKAEKCLEWKAQQKAKRKRGGGIVDRNRLKGASMAKASEQQIAAQQLPLAKYVEMGSYSRVLTVPRKNEGLKGRRLGGREDSSSLLSMICFQAQPVNRISRLDLGNCGLHATGLDMLQKVLLDLEHRGDGLAVEELVLDGNDFGDAGTVAIASLLRLSSKLRVLRLRNVGITDGGQPRKNQEHLPT